ncbi:MAG: indole-3-glycerol phosphate synthase TrpC [Muribaculaceae bacterium]
MAVDILEDIIAYKAIEVERNKAMLSTRELYKKVEMMAATPTASFSQALQQSSTGIIAEFKRKSPSKGWINEQSNVQSVALSYQQHGAAAISILTDEHFFGGSDAFIRMARESGVTLPILYKNFVIDEYQLLQAKLCGASAVLLIAAALTMERYRQLLHEAHNLGLEVLLEMHSEQETAYASHMPDLCGINNRNLGSFVTDVNNSFRLASSLPKEAVKVSESGITSAEVILRLREVGYRGFLIGEQLMKNPEPGQALAQLTTAITANNKA